MPHKKALTRQGFFMAGIYLQKRYFATKYYPHRNDSPPLSDLKPR
ncbi:hypothetical protein PLUA15_200013 [Pseudomonas lundensis]|uniref:Uncharacterized protein n=1 Tax=Pseudomonas lundensis TaxID=86185 RepID=A0AAX2H5Y0_9PSED|nr:hypothetical protein PLUA15_200013 [Pseudomonas lundensis]